MLDSTAKLPPMRVPILLCLSLVLIGCSTIESRIQEIPAAYYTLPPPDQHLIRMGGIREGFTQDQVYIAWGRPDTIRRSYRGRRDVETWIYTGTRHEEIPNWELHPFGFRCGVIYEPVYRPVILSIPYFVKAVTFEGSRVVEWEQARP